MQSNTVLSMPCQERPDALATSHEVSDAAASRRTEGAVRALRASHLHSLAAYWDCLNAFDWGFEYSDDPGVYRRGHAGLADLERRAGDSMAHAELFSRYRAHQNAKQRNADGQALDVPAKPERPVLPS